MSIKAIDASSVHQITSGQVIVDLQSAVKELLENSLDAGASIVDVKFKDYGTVSFEVSDNGSGIESTDYDSIALKSHTSKLATYDGLNEVTSFGFRGEALSSLCQLANVTITTATKQKAPVADVLTFDKRGRLLQTTKTARAAGTTVTVSKLFEGVPVRRKEFERNHKKHFANAQNLVQAYGLISTGVRISISNQQGTKSQNMFKTDGKSIRENYAILFKASSALTLMDFDTSFTVEAEKRVLKTVGLDEMQTQVQVKGLVSKPTQGNGRTSSDRQFFYINGRPFDTKNIAKAFNEVYKNYVPNHYPSIVADFILPTDTYDVNVSPDKRSIFLHSERNLVEALKGALEQLFQPSRSTYNADAADLTRVGRTQSATQRARTTSALLEEEVSENADLGEADTSGLGPEGESRPSAHAPRRSRSVASADIDGDDMPLFRQETPTVLAEIVDEIASDSAPSSPEAQDRPAPKVPKQRAGQGPSRSASPVAASSVRAPMQMTLDTNGASWNLQPSSGREPARKKARLATGSGSKQATVEHFRTFTSASGPMASGHLQPVEADDEDEEAEEKDEGPEGESRHAEASSEELDTLADDARGEKPSDEAGTGDPVDNLDGPISAGPAEAIHSANGTASDDIDEEGEPLVRTDSRKTTESDLAGTLNVDLSRIRQRNLARRRHRQRPASPLTPSSSRAESEALENAGIDHEPEEAQQTLSRLVSKADFASMEVVGQFNVAFIIARRRHAPDAAGKGKGRAIAPCDDLMIIDQHASDEKYNFERLQLVTKIDSQRLIRPRELNLTASDELLAIEHQEVLRFNGFEIEVDEDAQAGQRIKLVAMPVSKATKKTEFTMQDLEELLYLLREHTGSGMIRPSKTRKLFAMLACRSSVMVGKVLNTSQMTSIVRHMGTMDQPWNCPHGRNTMRWLRSLEKPVSEARFAIPPASFRSIAASMEDSQSQSQ